MSNIIQDFRITNNLIIDDGSLQVKTNDTTNTLDISGGINATDKINIGALTKASGENSLIIKNSTDPKVELFSLDGTIENGVKFENKQSKTFITPFKKNDSNDIVDSSSVIINLSGHIGIGDIIPTRPLEINVGNDNSIAFMDGFGNNRPGIVFGYNGNHNDNTAFGVAEYVNPHIFLDKANTRLCFTSENISLFNLTGDMDNASNFLGANSNNAALTIEGNQVGIKTANPIVSLDVRTTDALRIPVGTNADRPNQTAPNTFNDAVDCSGCIRYNSETTQFEGWSPTGNSWIGLGGVIDIDQDTYVAAEENSDEDKLRFYTAGTQKMIIDTNGNVGINKNTPVNYKLDIQGTLNASGATTLGDTLNVTGATTLSDTLNVSGNVGIGTTSPGEKLEVIGTVKATALMYGTTNVALALSTKQATITGAASEITSDNLTFLKALVSNGNGKVAVSTVTSTELGYLDGVTSSIQTQLGTKAHKTNPTFTGTFSAGHGNTVSGDYSVALGASNTTSGNYSFAAGWLNTPKSSMTVCMGQKNDILAEANYAFAAGICNKIAEPTSGTTCGCVALGNKAYVGEDIRFAIGISDTNPNTTHATSASDSNNKFVIDKDGNVGIGTTSPGQKLEVNGKIKITNGTYIDSNQIQNNNGTFYIHYNNDNTVSICTLRGKVGIGTSSPAEKLHVSGTVKATALMYGTTDVATKLSYLDGVTNGIQAQIDSKVSSQWNKSGSNIYYSDGNVGIGTNSPKSLLDIGPAAEGIQSTLGCYAAGDRNFRTVVMSGSAASGPAGSIGLWYKHTSEQNNSENTMIHFHRGGGVTGGYMVFTTHNGAERMRIDNYGRVGIGTTSPEAGLHVTKTKSTDMTSYSLGYLNTTGGNGGWTPGQPLNIAIKTTNGAIWSDGVQIIVSSDKRIKENIVEVNDDKALQKVRDISCCWYNYKDKVNKGNQRPLGFIAQQVKEHLPEAVSMQKNIIPDEMKKIQTTWNETKMSSNDLQDVSGIKYRFYVNNDISDNEKMIELIGDEDNCFTFEQKWENVFCYGKEVDDFHALDKQKLFALNFSATQEIDRIQQEEKIKLENTIEENIRLKNKIANLEAKQMQLEQLIQNLISKNNLTT